MYNFVATVALFAKVPVSKLSIKRTRAIQMAEWPQSLLEGRGELKSEEAELSRGWQLGEVELGVNIPSISLDIIGATQVRHLRSLTLPQVQSPPMPARFIRLAETAGTHVTHLRLDISRPGFGFIPSSNLTSKLLVFILS